MQVNIPEIVAEVTAAFGEYEAALSWSVIPQFGGTVSSGQLELLRDDLRLLDDVARPEAAGLKLLQEASERLGLSARGYHRVLRVARTLADLEGAEAVARIHVAEAIGYRSAGTGLLAAA